MATWCSNCILHIPNVSSLPQGWHFAAGGSKISASSSVGVSGSSVPVNIRRKWNSPMSTNVPQTRLPSYKSSTLRQQNYHISSTYHTKSTVTANTSAQTKLPTPTKPSPVREYKNEIEKLKKEISTIKAENSILKAKVRRVDDENLQKGRQIEKMRAEIESLQKNESASSKRSKESQELRLLRQKCLRLENALKDKDITIKQLTSEALMKKADEARLKSSKLLRKIYQATPETQTKSTLKENEKESASTKSSLSRSSLSLKTEVAKLRDMIHKLEKENQDLQQQAKLHCQEIRRLKIQLKNKDKMPPPQTSVSKSSNPETFKSTKNKSALTEFNSPGKVQTKTSSSSIVPKQRLVKRAKSPLQPQATSKVSPPQSSLHKGLPKIEKIPILPNGKIKQASRNNEVKSMKSKLPVTKPVIKKLNSSYTVVKNGTKNEDLEHKVQEMRENIAAKKIQRSWRQHQKDLQHTSEIEFKNGGKALAFIISSIKHHKLRKDKLHFLVKKNNVPDNIKNDVFMEVIESMSKKVWNQDFPT